MKWLKKIGLSVLVIYCLVCVLVYCFQERLIFFPDKLPNDYQLRFEEPFIEMKIPVNEEVALSCVLFKASHSKGCIFYLHGNAGSIQGWGKVAKPYLDLGYDVWFTDYRGYGKSSGTINSENALYNDVQTAYDSLLHYYPENKVTVLGYSLGTGLAAYVASKNHPKQLILQAPYYSFKEVVKEHYPFLPTAVLRYKFPTWEYLSNTRVPVTVFHGDADEVIDYKNADLLLRPFYKPEDQLFILKGQRHNGMTENIHYREVLPRLFP